MRYFWLILCLFSVIFASGQKSSRVRELERQRRKALSEIETTNRLLQETRRTTKNSLNRLNLLSKQILSRKQVISLLNQEIGEIDKQIANSRKEINLLEKELQEKRQNYGKSMQSLYKRRSSQDKLLFILSAETFAQSFRRIRYLQEYAGWQKRLSIQIISKQKKIADQQAGLQKIRSEKNNLLKEREKENRKLQEEESNQKNEVDQLNKRQKDLQAELKKKQRQAADLNRQIEQQIAKEVARAEAQAKAARNKAKRGKTSISGNKTETEKEKASNEERVAETKGGYAMTRAEKQLSINFAGNRGILPYPVTGRYTVVSSFGEHQHQELKHVRTNNSGIDIRTAPGADARAVFNGEVTRVFVVPGYNNSVIVRHGNYLTVYSNLSQVYVKAGDKVSTRQALGKIFTDTEDENATILHFQVWKEKTKLNPAFWLE